MDGIVRPIGDESFEALARNSFCFASYAGGLRFGDTANL